MLLDSLLLLNPLQLETLLIEAQLFEVFVFPVLLLLLATALLLEGAPFELLQLLFATHLEHAVRVRLDHVVDLLGPRRLV